MPSINLIREQRIATLKRDKAIRVAFMGTVGVGVIAVLFALTLMVDAARLTFQANSLEERKHQLAPVLAELKENQDEIDVLKPRLETLKLAQSYTVKWGDVLDHLTKNTPAGLWLTGVRSFQQDKTKPLTITFTGMSDSQQTIGEMIIKLQQSPDLENIVFKGSSERQEGTEKYYEFEITADMVGSKQDDAPKEKTA